MRTVCVSLYSHSDTHRDISLGLFDLAVGGPFPTEQTGSARAFGSDHILATLHAQHCHVQRLVVSDLVPRRTF